jgi:serine/threonine-protein kinase
MPLPSAKRVAALAVRRYGADRLRVGQAVRSILKSQGQAVDMVAALLADGLLTPAQVHELCQAFETNGDGSSDTVTHDLPGDSSEEPTHLDLRAAPPGEESNTPAGNAAADNPDAEPRWLGGFRVLCRLGEGSMGVVYLGFHEKQHRHVAIKVLSEALAAHPVCVDRFYREAKNAGLLFHPNIVRGFSAFYDESARKHYHVRELVDGLSSQVLLDSVGRLPVGAAVQIAIDIARALEYLHGRGVVHRDIKPDNVLLTRSGEIKLTDLALLHRIGEPVQSHAGGHAAGTSYYMPPEQAQEAAILDGRSDLYALGATLYHLLTGEAPFGGSTHQEIMQKKITGVFIPASEVNPDVPGSLDRILNRLLARDPAQRYGSATPVISDLEASELSRSVVSYVRLNDLLHGREEPVRLEHPEQGTRPDFHFPVNGASAHQRTSLRSAAWLALFSSGLALAVLTLLAVALSYLVRA